MQKRKRKVFKAYLKAKALMIIFYRQSNLSQFKEIVISNLKLKGLGPEKVPFK